MVLLTLDRLLLLTQGTVFGVTMMCLETPAGGDPDINLHSATEATGVEDTPISNSN